MSRRSHPDAAVCRQIVRRHARTFFAASVLLPRDKRRGAFAVYAVCRRADDIVDVGPERDAQARLARFRDAVATALNHTSPDPVLREIRWAVDRYQLPQAPLWELFDGVAADLDHQPIESWPGLLAYCEGVAGSVGELTLGIFGLTADADRRSTVLLARKLGVAMQLTNILRDVGEDARRGRCYFPLDELERFGLTRASVIDGSALSRRDAWRAFMAFQVDRAHALYRLAVVGVLQLDGDAQRCAVACAEGYARILRAVEGADYDTYTSRASIGRRERLRVAWDAMRRRAPSLGFPSAVGRGGAMQHASTR